MAERRNLFSGDPQPIRASLQAARLLPLRPPEIDATPSRHGRPNPEKGYKAAEHRILAKPP